MKKIPLILLLICLLLLCASCTPKNTASPLNIAVLRGPTGISAVWLMEQVENGQANYNIHLADNPEQVVALLTNGTVDIAAVPSNLAATLYSKTEGSIQITAIITKGVLYLLQAGDTIKNWEDLRGRTIYATGRGANPEYILNHLLKEHDLQPGLDVAVEYKDEHAELAALLAAGQVEIAMLPEPFVTSSMLQNENLHMVFDLSAEWQALGQGELAMTALVSKRDFLLANPQIISDFLADMKSSINYAINNATETATLCEKHDIIPKAAVAERAIPRCNLTFISGEDMKEAIFAYYQVLYTANPQSVGGALPDDGFFYIH
ncbi:MAG: ABC transporter substrate-binding protein [Firmicutes bacterium]|nr:ABC transporter substrate-binding protein [Bacillota bacterium]